MLLIIFSCDEEQEGKKDPTIYIILFFLNNFPIKMTDIDTISYNKKKKEKKTIRLYKYTL